MKKILLVFSLVFSYQFLLASKIEVKGSKAVKIIEALKQNKVVSEKKSNLYLWHVVDVICVATPTGFNPCECKMINKKDDSKKVQAIGPEAFDFYHSVVKAGVKPEELKDSIKAYRFQLKRLECKLGVDEENESKADTICEIEQ
jgi:hypothetical protein